MNIKTLSLAFAIIGMVVYGFTTDRTDEKTTGSMVSTVNIGTNVGDLAPEIEMMGLDGKTNKLSDLRGQLVLIDF